MTPRDAPEDSPMTDFLTRVQTLLADPLGPPATCLLHCAHWDADPAYGPDYVEVICNDLFAWGSADGEPLTPATLPVLEQAMRDLQAVTGDGTCRDADLLYCCRQRQRRPQPPYYRHLRPAVHALFDACGPPRYL